MTSAERAQAFWARVRKIGLCWEWTGSLDTSGYGLVRVDGRLMKAHRYSYLLTRGSLPPPTCVVRHKCDNPVCVNPDHLEPGTRADNTRDRDERNRFVCLQGEAHGMHKLTERDVRWIRENVGLLSGAEMARKLRVSPTAVNRAALRQTWRHI
jgi:hypothetical protein